MVTVDAGDVGARAAEPQARSYEPGDLVAASDLLARCGGRLRVRRGVLVDTAILPGLVVVEETTLTGLVTFTRRPDELDIMVLAADPLDERTRELLLDAVVRGAGGDVRRIVASASNADFTVQRSLQLAGFRICAVRAGTIESTRARLAPGRLPDQLHGLPIRDEIEFELVLR